MWKKIVKLLAALNSNTRPGEIAGGVSFGFLLALQPGYTVFRIVLFILTFFLKVNLAAVLLFLFLFSIITPLLDGILDSLGGFILTLPALQSFFTSLYNIPLVPYTRFNNTIVMGGLVLGILLWLPIYVAGNRLIGLYRTTLRDRIAEHPLVKGFLRLPVVSTLAKYIGKAIKLSQEF
jgi:uncharacterized protein (TIGR03546 family)